MTRRLSGWLPVSSHGPKMIFGSSLTSVCIMSLGPVASSGQCWRLFLLPSAATSQQMCHLFPIQFFHTFLKASGCCLGIEKFARSERPQCPWHHLLHLQQPHLCYFLYYSLRNFHLNHAWIPALPPSCRDQSTLFTPGSEF